MRPHLWLFSILLVAAVAGESVRADSTGQLRVMTFNIEWGGEHVSFDAVVEAIQRSGADLVGIQEAEGNLERLAHALGWHFDGRNDVISRYPLLDPPGADGRYVFVELAPGRVLVHANLHLPSDPYGPDLVRDGRGIAEVLANEEAVRVPALLPYLETLAKLAQRGMPVIVTGDFNSPAHTDWTAPLVGKRPFLSYPVAWPVSLAMAESGFRDAWREVYRDPVKNPGLTWWAGRPPIAAYAPGENDAQDRIDFLWYAGPVSVQSAYIAGEESGPEVSVRVSPWPSDHRAVYADFTVDPFPVPDLVTTGRQVYRQGSDIGIRGRFSAPGDWIVSVTNDEGEVVVRRAAEAAAMELMLPAPAPGEYRVTATTDGKLLERTFWMLPAAAAPDLDIVDTGTGLAIRWRNAPGNRNDYIAIYDAEETDIVNGMQGYAYLSARPRGTIDLREVPGFVPDASRTYVARLLEDDGYNVLAESSPFDFDAN